MTHLTSSICNRFGHPEFRISFDEASALEIDAQLMITYLEGQVKAGVIFRPQQTIQIGWMVVMVKEENGEFLTLAEPDLQEVPIRFVYSVTNTLRHLRLQRDVAASIGVTAEFPSIRQSAIKCSKYDDGRDFLVERAKAEQNDSGWFLGCTHSSHDHQNPSCLLRVSLYELACSRSEIIPFMALPSGCSVTVKGSTIQLNQNGFPCSVKPGSYLDLKMHGAV
jgi:hypothetical protein